MRAESLSPIVQMGNTSTKRVLVVGRQPRAWVKEFLAKYKGRYTTPSSVEEEITLYTDDENLDIKIYTTDTCRRWREADIVVVLHDESYTNIRTGDRPCCVVYTSQNPSMACIDDNMVVENAHHKGILVFTWIARECLGSKTDLRESWCTYL